jgi:hypothetical protein
VEFWRTTDYQHVREILTCPSIYSLIGDDYLPPREQFEVNRHPDVHYILASEGSLVGLFSLFPLNRIWWDIHVAMIPWASKDERMRAARGIAPWLGHNTECRRLAGAVPQFNRAAVYYVTHGLRMKYVGRHEKAFMREGHLHDLLLFGLSLDGD